MMNRIVKERNVMAFDGRLPHNVLICSVGVRLGTSS